METINKNQSTLADNAQDAIELETRLHISIFWSRYGGWKVGDKAQDDDVSTGFANLKALEASYLADLAELDAWEAYNSKKQAEHEAYLDSLEAQK